ncbi:MFS transporter [Micromonosporaceae bacterium Da 78-11]
MSSRRANSVGPAGPSLQASLGASPVGLQWVIGGYALTLGAGLILGGRLGDRFGRRRMFLLGLAAFTLVSALCAAAPTMPVLIALRLAQGLAGAMLLPQGLGLLRENFDGKELAKVFGIFAPVLGLGGIIGPVLGGGLIEADPWGLGRRTVFLVNVPIGIAALIVAWRILPHRDGDRTVGVDTLGAALVVASPALLVLPLKLRPGTGLAALDTAEHRRRAGRLRRVRPAATPRVGERADHPGGGERLRPRRLHGRAGRHRPVLQRTGRHPTGPDPVPADR